MRKSQQVQAWEQMMRLRHVPNVDISDGTMRPMNLFDKKIFDFNLKTTFLINFEYPPG
jgi:hypothetical protein